MLKHTPLFKEHLLLKVKLVPFAGWEMPVSYPQGILAEHRAVRSSCGIFDVGHMGILKVKNEKRKAKSFINWICTNDISRAEDFSSQYSIICNEAGGVVDDVLIYCLPEFYYIVTNAVNTEKVLKWMARHNNHGAEFEHIYDRSLLAVQGPESEKVIEKYFKRSPQIKKNHSVYFGDILVSRTGYTGEDGFELFVPNAKVEKIWRGMLDLGVQPCGLGSRDTLRLEAGFPLYEHEYDENTSPLDAGYGWAVKFNKEEFIGRKKLWEEKQEGPKKKLAGIIISGRAVARRGFQVFSEEEKEIGLVTSGTFSPTLEKPIALAYINRGYQGKTVKIKIRGDYNTGEIAPLPFYRKKP